MNNRRHLNTLSVKSILMLFLFSVVLLSVCTSCGSKKETNKIHYDIRITNINLESRFYEPPKDASAYYFSSNDLFYKTKEGLFDYGFDETGNPQSTKLPLTNSEFNKNEVNAQIVRTDVGDFYRLEQLFYPKEVISGSSRNTRTPIKEREFFLEKYNKNGELLFCKDIGLEIGYNTGNIYRITADKEDNLYFANKEIIILFDPDGNVTHKIPCDFPAFYNILRSDNNIWVFYGKDRTVATYAARVTKDGKLTDERNCLGFWQCISPLSEDRFLHSADGKLYLTDFKNNSVETLAQWSDLSISPEEISGFTASKDGRLIATLRDPIYLGTINEIAVISEADETQSTDKEVLTLGVFYTNKQVRAKIASFNRSNEKIRINLKEYADQNLERNGESLDYTKVINSLHLDIVSGKCPDILCLDYDDIEDLAYKNVFENLTPYIDGENDFDIPANVTAAYTFQDMLVGIPLYVQVRTLFLKDSDFSGKWTTDRFMEYLSKKKEAGADIPDAESTLKYLLTCNLDSFVDFEANSCEFTSGKFERLLSLCKDISGSAGNTETPEIFEILYSVRDAYWGNTEMIETRLAGLWDISALIQIFETKDLNFVGYPHDSKDSGYILEAVGGAYSISSFSKYKESAWEFIKYMAKEDQKASPTIYLLDHSGFPMEIGSRKEYYDYTGNPFRYAALSFREPKPEETEQLEAIISSARMLSKKETDILGIVLEEANDYITLNKPLHDVAESVQNRVNLYLIE